MEKLEINKESLGKLARGLDARFVVLYGSFANGSPGNESDLDVAVYLKTESVPLNFDKYAKCLGGLEEVFSAKAPIDLVVLNNANILLRYEITSKGTLLYGDADDYEQYKAFAFRDYLDAKPLFTLEELLINRRQVFLKEAIV